MEDVQVCRICLNTDVKMQDLSTYPLESYFASFMIESKPLYTNLPPYACFECAALVKKFHLFRQKCLRSQGLLCAIIDDCGKITCPAIKSISRKNLLVLSNVSHISIAEDGTTQDINVEQPPFIVEIIKKEDHDDVDVPDHISPDISSCEEDEVNKNDRNNIHDVEKVEIPLKMDIQEESDGAELLEVAVDSPKLPIKKSNRQKAQSRKGIRPKKSRTIVAKKSPAKVTEDDKPHHEMTDDLINVINLSLEDQYEEVNKRKQSSNYLNCPYQCHLCYRGFNNAHAWKHHQTKHSPNLGDIECKICKYRFKTKRNLQRHALNHGKRYVCNLCPYNSSNITTVKQHQGSHKGVTHKCKFCDEVFNVRTTYVIHMRIKHPSENICGYCGYSFYSKQGLVVHKNMMHKDIDAKQENAEEGPYCEECDVKFISTEAYKRHMVMSVKHTRSTDAINGCRVCGETFEDPEELRLHNREEHPKKQPKHYNHKRKSQVRTKWPAKCEHCPEEFATPRSYWNHFRLKHPDQYEPAVRKNCVCDICGKRYACNAVLEMHKRTHFDERPYKCSECDKACHSAQNLRVHMQKHSNTRPFPCTVCAQAFKRKEALERHLKIHSGDNPYKCEICGVAFAKSCTRTLHVRTVHTKEPPPPRKRRTKPNK